jgi:hypothetical protein
MSQQANSFVSSSSVSDSASGCEFANLSDYRRHMVQSLRTNYSSHGHLFAPTLTTTAEEQRGRELLDSYMRQLIMLPFGAAILQVDVQGQRAIDEAIADGSLYELGGVWAKRVHTETFSYYAIDPEAEGQEEWLSFFKDETYISRTGQIRQKMNQAALNLAFKKPLEGEVIAEVEGRFQRWYQPVMDLFRRHWEVRETIEGRMILRLYYEYAANVQRVLQQYQGDEQKQLRSEKITAIMDQYLSDTEEVRLTAKDRSFTEGQIIDAVRRAVHNFCVEQNRRIVSLLGTKKTVSMFLEGGTAPAIVFHTNKVPSDYRSAALSPAERVAMATRCFIRLAQNDQNRSKLRMDEKASTTYAPVSHAETQQARAALQPMDVVEQEQEESRQEDLPFGLSFAREEEPDSAVDEGLSHLSVIDAMATEGELRQWAGSVDLKRAPFVICLLEGSLIRTVERFPSIEEATGTMRKSLAKLASDSKQAEIMRSRTKLIYDSKAHLGSGGSTRLLKTLEPDLAEQLKNQGDRYWYPWVIVSLIGSDHAIATVVERFDNLTAAALHLQNDLYQKKQTLKVEQFRAEAGLLRLVQDLEGSLPNAELSKSVKALPKTITDQLELPHYEVRRGKILIRLNHLNCDPAEIDQVSFELAKAMTHRIQQAKAALSNTDAEMLQSVGF